MSALAWIGAAIGVLGSAGLGGLVKTWLDHKRERRAQSDGVALELVKQLTERVDKLERSLAEERARCEAELRMMRHRIGGWKQLFYSLLHLFDLPARQRKDTLDSVRREMAALETAEKAETGAMLGARIKGDDSDDR